MRLLARTRSAHSAGFTLAEVAVTVAIVAIAVTVSLQSLETAKLTAAQTRNMRIAREIGLELMGQIEAGLFREDLETGRGGSVEINPYLIFYYEFTLGDETFLEDEYADEGERFDNWSYQRELDRERDDYDEFDDEEDQEQPFEEVRIKITLPVLREEFTKEIVIERWIPWAQVYGESEEDLEEGEDAPGGDALPDDGGGR